MKKAKTLYSVSDDKEIIDYILNNDLESEVKGNQVWKGLEKEIEERRSWQSLKNRYLKNIVMELHLPKYGLVTADIKRLKSGANIKSQSKKPSHSHSNLCDTSPGHLYTLDEDKQILRALLESSLKCLRGNEIWKRMVKNGVCEGRTYQSMRNRFIKNIFPKLESEVYGLSASDVELLKLNMVGYDVGETVKSPETKFSSGSNKNRLEKPSKRPPASYYSLNINTSDEDTE